MRADILSAGLGLCALTVLSGCSSSNYASRAYEKTAVFGETREVVRRNGEPAYQFPYRDGIVTYLPARGSFWEKSADPVRPPRKTVAGAGADSLLSDRLPHGCLVFACARAETLRESPSSGATRAQAIAFQRTDGSGHAFAVYDRDGATWAEDDRGYRVKVDRWKDRSPEEALRLSKQFSVQTHPANFPKPASARFVGDF